MSEGVRLYAGTQAGLIVWRSGRLCSRARTVPSRGRESRRSCRRSRLDDLGVRGSSYGKPRALCRFLQCGAGSARGSGGAGDLMVSRNMGKSWQRLDINLPADLVLWAASD